MLKPFASTQEVAERIRQRRAQMLIHSCIYYEMDDNVISDHKWQEWADELVDLQNYWPELCEQNFFDEHFADWTGATGNHLPHRHPWVYNKALQVLRWSRREQSLV